MRLLSMMSALILSSMGGVSLGASPAYSASEETAIEVAYVSEVSGRVVALMQGRPTLLEALDILTDRTRLDLQANSELRMCHYQTHQLLTLRGPLKASISRDGVTAENGKAVVASAGSCATPTASVFQAGFISRGVPARR
jgi:hypothetical protein